MKGRDVNPPGKYHDHLDYFFREAVMCAILSGCLTQLYQIKNRPYISRCVVSNKKNILISISKAFHGVKISFLFYL